MSSHHQAPRRILSRRRRRSRLCLVNRQIRKPTKRQRPAPDARQQSEQRRNSRFDVPGIAERDERDRDHSAGALRFASTTGKRRSTYLTRGGLIGVSLTSRFRMPIKAPLGGQARLTDARVPRTGSSPSPTPPRCAPPWHCTRRVYRRDESGAPGSQSQGPAAEPVRRRPRRATALPCY